MHAPWLPARDRSTTHRPVGCRSGASFWEPCRSRPTGSTWTGRDSGAWGGVGRKFDPRRDHRALTSTRRGATNACSCAGSDGPANRRRQRDASTERGSAVQRRRRNDPIEQHSARTTYTRCVGGILCVEGCLGGRATWARSRKRGGRPKMWPNRPGRVRLWTNTRATRFLMQQSRVLWSRAGPLISATLGDPGLGLWTQFSDPLSSTS